MSTNPETTQAEARVDVSHISGPNRRESVTFGDQTAPKALLTLERYSDQVVLRVVTGGVPEEAVPDLLGLIAEMLAARPKEEAAP